ncbi:MAG TPA: DUF1015 domain-containing protein [Treponemataceae bacterium]|jgi:uncharacterized protein (DUF1015 family)|nr:DUF1015 domain-containing protein [Treponemataceae bacterium]
MNTFTRFGITIPHILLPKEQKQMDAWPVIACDQYTQDRSYWEKVEALAKDKPSTVHITLPEVYLNLTDKPARINSIREKMNEYLNSGVFADPIESMIYVERKTEYGRTRKGLVTAVDLETYEWKPFSKALIRATEATIVDRIPPRMEIRKGAPLETPHIMLLVDDPNKTLIEALGNQIHEERKEPLYNTELMMKAGHLKGWKADSPKDIALIEKALCGIEQQNTEKDGSVFMFAVGDGNHSLATAKAVWDEYKKEHGVTEHPSRYALIEIVNIYDEGLTFEPIHRVLFGINSKELLNYCTEELEGKVSVCSSAQELEDKVEQSKAFFGFVYEENGKTVYNCLETEVTELAVSRLQPVLDKFLENNKTDKTEIDYIHGSEEVFRLGGKNGAVSILLPPIAKDSFFATIGGSGPLPRKSFSMGEASEKRFYMECRRLF